MPVERVTVNGKPGYRWGKSGKVYLYTPGSVTSRSRAYASATRQGQAARAAGYRDSDAGGEQTYTPPANVAAAARDALELRASLPPSRRAMTPTGLARARDLSNRRPVSLDTVRRMKNYFDRHEVDKQGEGWGQDSKGYQAWLGWGGDPGRAWANSILKRQIA
jgi:hypothetical protein